MAEDILVHVSAPATRQTDELYRSVADAYLEFEPRQPVRFDHQKSRNGETDHRKIKLSVATGPIARDAANNTLDMPTQHGNGASFGSFPSPSAFEPQRDEPHASLPLNIADSNNDSFLDTSRLGQLEKIQHRWKQRRSLPTSTAEEQRPTSRNSAQPFRNETQFIESTQFAAQGIESQLFEDLSFFTQSTEGSRRSVALRSSHNVRSAHGNTSPEKEQPGPVPFDPRPSLPSGWGSSFVTGTNDEGHPPAARKAETSTTLAPKSYASSQQHLGIHEESDVNDPQPPISVSISTLPSEVFAPAPKVSTDSPGSLPSQVTKYLGAVLQQNPNRFKPSEMTRLLVADERGYWSLVCSEWPQRAQLDFWMSLCDHVCAGRWGWGITAHRVPPSDENFEDHTVREVRIYCWGEIVEHVWLALWLCSKGRVSESRSRWIDADDSMVIQVP
ncbi:hypothetical protein BDV96DRAFT_570078 [Lophiotrema nucula]|uniref:Uncharacterized protein n=1 Tax=Lophiotrema nucula TaxID=690887 RepID=A0A6A5ZHF7_9PLEO|nr:hypothetical protein BDV96DRAFT_570078 [Lophiotrema nucula]